MKTYGKIKNGSFNASRKFTTQASLDSRILGICQPVGRETSVKKKRPRWVFPSEPPYLSYYRATCRVKYKNSLIENAHLCTRRIPFNAMQAAFMQRRQTPL